MIARILSVVLGGSLLVFAALMIGAVFWARGAPEPMRARADASAELSVQTDMGLLEAKIFLFPDLAYEIDIHVDRDADAIGPVRPRFVLAMTDMVMEPVMPPLLVLSANEFHGAGRLSMPGRWRFRLGFGEELHDIEVIVPR